MIDIKIKLDDLDMYKELMKQSAEVEVGYFDDKVYEGVDTPFYANVAKPNSKTAKNRSKTVTAREVATFNEFGGGHTPPRPFVRYTKQRYTKNWVKFVQDDLPVTMDAEDTFTSLGKMIKGHLSDTVKAWKYPPNAPSTVKAKGFNNPLVDSGNMSEDFIEIRVNGGIV